MNKRKGNQFWKLRSKHGRNKLFATPELLWEAACQYFEWSEAHPFVKRKTRIQEGTGDVSEETITSPVPFSLRAFQLYIGASPIWWNKLRERCKRQNDINYLAVIDRIENIIKGQQLEGALVGVFNSNIVARELGLAGKKSIEPVKSDFKGFQIVIKEKDD